jgi:hypothetical protein
MGSRKRKRIFGEATRKRLLEWEMTQLFLLEVLSFL